jgi:drug/metabolite transporter (DMT)-like permease
VLLSWCIFVPVPIEAFHNHRLCRDSITLLCTSPRSFFHDARYVQTGPMSTRRKLTPFDPPSDKNVATTSIWPSSDKDRAILVLFSVPLAWGTFEPAVRLVYQYQPNIPPFLFSLAYYLAASIGLGLFAFQVSDGPDVLRGEAGGLEQEANSVSPALGGIELGTYLFVGNALQVIGLKTVPSDRAAFLLQLTTIFVPLVQSFLSRDFSIIPARTWLAAVVALFGVAMIGLDGSHATIGGGGPFWLSLASLDPDNFAFSPGDLFIMLGALFYTFHCIRLELYSRRTSAIRLAAAKATTEAAWSALFLVCISALALLPADQNIPLVDVARGPGDDLLRYLHHLGHDEVDPHWLDVGAATLWIGLVTVAYTIYAQSFGQSKVPAATANLIYTIQPFFTAVVAFIILGERLGPFGYFGGFLIGSAVLLVVLEEDEIGSKISTDESETSI